MPRPPLRRALLLVAALTLVACTDAQPVAPIAASSDDVSLAKSSTKPNGTGIGVISSKRNRAAQPVDYHGGPVMSGALRVYLIWYGQWTSHPAVPIVTDFVANLGGSAYFAINMLYGDAAGGSPSSGVLYAGSINDNYSRGANISESDVDALVSTTIAGGGMPTDPHGVYVVLTAADVQVAPGFGTNSGTSYCARRSFTTVNGVTIKYAFVGYPGRVPDQCQPQVIGPNGNGAGDAIASILANVFSNTVTDPLFSAWYDRNGLEPADKCAWSYGSTYTTPNGARANVRLGNRDFLLQQLWVPAGRGYCALAAPGT